MAELEYQLKKQTINRAISHIAPTVAAATGQTGVEKSIKFVLGVYSKVLPHEQLRATERLLRIYSQQKPESLHFGDPYSSAWLRMSEPVIDLPDFPVRKIKKDKDPSQLADIIFDQSPASAIPYWAISQRMAKGEISLGDEVLMVDLCAAPGNKSLNALHLPGVKKVTAVLNDASPKRLARTRERLRDFGFSEEDEKLSAQLPDGREITAYLTNVDASDPKAVENLADTYLQGQYAHIVLADVPCPGDGRILTDPARAFTIKHPRIEKIDKETAKIQAILRNALSITAPDRLGITSYSTCSVNPLLNEYIATTAVRDPKVKALPSLYDGEYLVPPVDEFTYYDKKSGKRLVFSFSPIGDRAYPHTLTEGFYVAQFIKER